MPKTRSGSSEGSSSSSLSMNTRPTKRQKQTPDQLTEDSFIVELDMTEDFAPLGVQGLTHTFMETVTSKSDPQLKEACPRVLKLLWTPPGVLGYLAKYPTTFLNCAYQWYWAEYRAHKGKLNMFRGLQMQLFTNMGQ